MILQQLLILLSGGMDSVTMLYEMMMMEKRLALSAVMFDYGQIHYRELDCARFHCDLHDIPWQKIEINRVFQGRPLSSRLVGGIGPSDVVHNRNAVMLSIASSIAAASNIEMVAYGCNQDDSKLFPDCRPEFVAAINAMNKASGTKVEIVTPYIGFTKEQIADKATQFGVNLDRTWSCYLGGSNPCGNCGACKLRNEAIRKTSAIAMSSEI